MQAMVPWGYQPSAGQDAYFNSPQGQAWASMPHLPDNQSQLGQGVNLPPGLNPGLSSQLFPTRPPPRAVAGLNVRRPFAHLEAKRMPNQAWRLWGPMQVPEGIGFQRLGQMPSIAQEQASWGPTPWINQVYTSNQATEPWNLQDVLRNQLRGQADSSPGMRSAAPFGLTGGAPPAMDPTEQLLQQNPGYAYQSGARGQDWYRQAAGTFTAPAAAPSPQAQEARRLQTAGGKAYQRTSKQGGVYAGPGVSRREGVDRALAYYRGGGEYDRKGFLKETQRGLYGKGIQRQYSSEAGRGGIKKKSFLERLFD